MRKTGTRKKCDHNHRSKCVRRHRNASIWQRSFGNNCATLKRAEFMAQHRRRTSQIQSRGHALRTMRNYTHTISQPAHSAQWAASPTQASSHTHSLIEPSGQLEESPASPAVTNSKAMSYSLPNHSNHPVGLSWVQKQGILSWSPLHKNHWSRAIWSFLCCFLFFKARQFLNTNRSPPDTDECTAKEVIKIVCMV